MFECRDCRVVFTKKSTYDNHFGIGRSGNKKESSHDQRMRELEELRAIRGLPPRTPMNLKPKEETLQNALIRNPNIKIVGGDGPGIPGKNGTLELTKGHGQTLNLFYGGRKDYKVFENFVYKINGEFKPSEINVCVYVQFCVEHPLFRYDGRINKTSDTFCHYVSSKTSHFRKSRKLMENEEERLQNLGQLGPNEEMSQQQYRDWINNGRRSSDTGNRSVFSNRTLHSRRDCHPLNARFDITFSYNNSEEVNSREGKQIEESESTYFFSGGHNVAVESGDGTRHHQPYRAPTAFVMLAPMSTQAKLDKWMIDNGVEKKYYVPAEMWSPPTQMPSVIRPSASSSSTTTPTTTISTSTPNDNKFPDEDIQSVMAIFPFSNRHLAIRCLQQLKENDLKRKNIEEESTNKRDTETAYRTICSLFPTAGEPQIRHLFHKYHNRANLVLSALQVAKHPLASDVASQLELSQKNFADGKDGDTDTVITSIPGDSKSIGMQSPFKMNSYGTESPARTGTPVSLLKFSNNQSSVGSLFTRWGSPQLSMSPQLNLVRTEGSTTKLQKSPKIKLKYLKGIFPAADETFLLDVLASCENNVQKASDKMLQKGFSRTPPPKPARHKWFEVKNLIEKRQKAINQQNMANMYHQAMGEPMESPFPTPLLKPARPHLTAQDKAKNREYLIEQFPSLPERFISWALEASKFDKNKAETLLREVGPGTPEEFKSFVVGPKVDGPSEGKKISFSDTVIEVTETMSLNNNIDVSPDKLSTKEAGDETLDTPDSGYFELESKSRKKNFITNLFNLKPKMENEKAAYISSAYARGPNSSFAKGPNPDLITTSYIPASGPRVIAKGPTLRQGPKQGAQGPNPNLAKGSMWAKTKNAKSNSNNNNNKQQHSVIVSVEG